MTYYFLLLILYLVYYNVNISSYLLCSRRQPLTRTAFSRRVVIPPRGKLLRSTLVQEVFGKSGIKTEVGMSHAVGMVTLPRPVTSTERCCAFRAETHGTEHVLLSAVQVASVFPPAVRGDEGMAL